MGKAEPVETPQQLADRYWNELADLVHQGEIDRSFADRVRTDMFEERPGGGPPQLRPWVWRIYLRELTGDFS